VLAETGAGRDEIEAFASALPRLVPGAQFVVVRPYSVGEPAVPGRPVTAAEVTIAVPAADGTPCTVKAVVVLETSAGLISRERVYYDADSLVACGWAR